MNLDEFNSIRTSVQTDRGEIAYAGTGDGPPAVFVHGLFVSSYMWRDVIAQLGDERRCIAYDLPAHGLTPPNPEQDLSLGGQASILESLCDALDLDEIDLVANDTGGAIAQAFAVRNPDRLRSFTLTNCEADDVLPADDPLPQAAAELAEQGQLAPLLVEQARDIEFARGELGIGNALQYPDRLDEEHLSGYLEPHMASEETAREIERFMRSLDVEDLIALRPQLSTLEVPTMMVWGTGDQFFPLRLAHWLKDTIPGATEVIEIEGGKLFWPGERPDELVPHLRRHWAAAAAARRTRV